MICSICKKGETSVVDSRPTEDGAVIRRRRLCICGQRFTTFERVQFRELIVVPSSVGRESTTDVSPFLQCGQIINDCYLKCLYMGKLEHKSTTSFLTSFSTLLLSLGFSDNPLIVFVINSPTNLNSFKPKPLVVAA